MIYLFVIILLLCLSLRYDINGKTKYRNEWYFVFLVVFILIAGLRWRVMVDTPNYIYAFYHRYPPLEKFSFVDYPIGKDPFYVLINSLVLSLGGRFYVVQLIEATVVNVLVFNYIKRHSSYLFTCLFFYAIICYMGYSMETMRASFSVVICLYANDYILDMKWVKGYMLLLLALMFHAQTIVMFILPLLFFLRFNKMGIIVLLGAFIVGYFIHALLGDYLNLLELSDEIENKADRYMQSEKFGAQAGNLNYFIVKILPTLMYSVISLIYIKRTSPHNKLLKLEPFIMLGMFFVIMRMNIEIAYRYVSYFSIHIVLFYSYLFVNVAKNIKKYSRGLAYMRAIVIFIPLFFLNGYMKYLRAYTFLPYSSVIEREIDRERERKYAETEKFTPSANINEY